MSDWRTTADDGGPPRRAVQPQLSTPRRKRCRSPDETASPTNNKRKKRTKRAGLRASPGARALVGGHEQHTQLHLPADPDVSAALVSQPEASTSGPRKHVRATKGDEAVPFSKRPARVQEMMKTLAEKIEEHGYPARNVLEPRLGESGANELMSFRPEKDWAKFGVGGQSVLTLMVDMSEGGGFACMWCEHRPKLPKWKRTVAHIRERHFHFRPFSCTREHKASW